MSLDAETRRILKDLIDARRREVIANIPPPTYRSKPGPKAKLPQVGSTSPSGNVYAVQHGTERAYKRYKCRCVECRDAARVARNIRRDRAERRCGFCGRRHCFEHSDLKETG